MTVPWTAPAGREIDSTPLGARPKPKRVVACLNVWNDVNALQRTVQTWLPYVDYAIAVDGAYNTLSEPVPSTDGTLKYLSQFPKIRIVSAQTGMSQCAKRSLFFELTQEGDYLFVVDADELVMGGAALRALPVGDVGWVQMSSQIYRRPYGQPRVIRWMPGLAYRGRHHWIYQHDALVCTHQYAGPGYEHHPVRISMQNQRNLGRSLERLALKRTNLANQLSSERVAVSMPSAKMSDEALGAREALHIVQHAYRDDGLAPSRFHTAINRTTPHWSIFFKVRPGPFGISTQYDARTYSNLLTTAMANADVAHFHSVMSVSLRHTTRGHTVFHHHGTIFRRNAESYMIEATRRNALVLLSNLELLSWVGGKPAHFMPNPMPVARYRALRRATALPGGTFRIGHSPSHPEKKGTEQFLRVCTKLQKLGVKVEPVMMHGVPHSAALGMKATCHAFFDSFWLGIQCSGLEAASMRMPVIAGDATVAARYKEHFGDVPYTFADSEAELEHQIHRLVTDSEFFAREADRVAQYVVQHHDEAAVALRYLDLLDLHFRWRTNLRVDKQPKPAAAPAAPARRLVRK